MSQSLPPFSCTFTPGIPELLASLHCSLAISTYQAGKVIMLSPREGQLIQLPRNFDKPMGMALDGDRLAVATREDVVVLVNAPILAPGFPPSPNTYDGLFAPRAIFFCGEVDLHDMVWDGPTLWAVNTRFSCLCQIDLHWSFTPVWQPPFVTDLTPDDRCHLNGMAFADGQPIYVTALGATDTPKGWRANKTGGGLLMHVPSETIIRSSLAMPHSPRLYDGQLFFLNSAAGALARVDPSDGHMETIVTLPSFLRGMARYGDYLFLGMSHIRRGRPLGDIPLAKRDLISGVAVVHLGTGKIVGTIQYLNSCEEIYDVQVVPGMLRPGILGIDQPLFRGALSLPDGAFWSTPEPEAEDRRSGQPGSGRRG